MAVTAIKRIENYANEKVLAVNIEKNGERYQIAAKNPDGSPGTVSVDWWIPWCSNSGEFTAGHHIEIHAPERPVPNFKFNIWQRSVNGDDRVRGTNSYVWDEYARPILGVSNVGGDRILKIFELDGPRAELEAIRFPQPTEGTASVGFFRPVANDPWNYRAFGLPLGAPTGSRIDRVTNTALDMNNQVKVPLTLSFVDKAGVSKKPLELEPTESDDGYFRGLLTEGTWTAVARNISAFFLKTTFGIDVFWTGEAVTVGTPIRAKHSNKVLDVAGISTANGAHIQQWDYLGGDNQKWRLESVGGGYYKIVAQHSGKVLDVVGKSTANGARIQQYDYLGGDNQKWRLEPLDEGYYRIVAKHSGKVLDVVGVSTANGAQIQQWDWVGGDNQRWMP